MFKCGFLYIEKKLHFVPFLLIKIYLLEKENQ